MTESDLIAALHDIRLPVLGPRDRIADIAAAVGIGLLLALGLSPLLRRLSRPAEKPPSIANRIKAARCLPQSAQQQSLLKLIAETNPEILRELGDDIYRPGRLPSVAELEKRLLQDA